MLLLLIASLLIYRKQAVYSGLYPMICKTNLNEKKKFFHCQLEDLESLLAVWIVF